MYTAILSYIFLYVKYIYIFTVYIYMLKATVLWCMHGIHLTSYCNVCNSEQQFAQIKLTEHFYLVSVYQQYYSNIEIFSMVVTIKT